MNRRDRRVLPHNLSAEASVLGGIILRNDVLSQLDKLEVDDFYDMKHKIVFGAIRALEAAAKPIDVVTLGNEIDRQGKLEAVGGFAFLGLLALNVPTEDNVVAYANIVQDKNTTRKLMLAASDIVEKGYEDSLDVQDFLSFSVEKITECERASPDSAIPIGRLAMRRAGEHEEMQKARERGETALTGVPTGIAKLDQLLGGWQFGIANMLAARPSMGKTSTALATGDAASQAGFPTHQFTLEDSWRSLADRMLSRESGISAERLRQGELDVELGQPRALGAAAVRLMMRTNWIVDDRAVLTAQEIVRSVRKERSKLKTKLVIIDYVQLVKGTPGQSENERLDEIITTFAHAAKSDDLCYLVLSQLNRKLEERPDKRPMMSDLRGSGALEERCKVIVGQYRGRHYHAKPKKHIDYECDCSDKSQVCPHTPTDDEFVKSVQLLILKNNNGRTGRVFASWNGPTTEIW